MKPEERDFRHPKHVRFPRTSPNHSQISPPLRAAQHAAERRNSTTAFTRRLYCEYLRQLGARAFARVACVARWGGLGRDLGHARGLGATLRGVRGAMAALTHAR